jgi:hypothetical protein
LYVLKKAIQSGCFLCFIPTCKGQKNGNIAKNAWWHFYKKNLGSLKKPPRHKPNLEQIQLLRNTIKATILIFLRMRF